MQTAKANPPSDQHTSSSGSDKVARTPLLGLFTFFPPHGCSRGPSAAFCFWWHVQPAHHAGKLFILGQNTPGKAPQQYLCQKLTIP